MKPFGSYNSKSKWWYFWQDKIPKKNRRYFNKSTRLFFKKLLIKELEN